MTDVTLDPRGPAGADGAAMLSDDRGPLPADGKDGDLWLNLSSFGLFKKVGGAWVGKGNLKGPAIPGSPGQQGRGVLVGSDAPGSDDGRVGDIYVQQTATGLVFWGPRTSAGWPSAGQPLSGTINGAGPPAAGLGLDGQVYIDTANLLFYGPKAAGSWGAPKFLQPVLSGFGAPSNATGLDGQVYIDLSGSALYGPRIGGAWPPGVSLIGKTSWKPVEVWATGVAYVAGPPSSIVQKDGSSYQCLVPHTSGVFLDDLNAGRWGLLARAGAAGAGSGTVTHTGSVIVGHLAVFADGTGDVLGDGGAVPAVPAKATTAQATGGTDDATYITPAKVTAALVAYPELLRAARVRRLFNAASFV